MTKVLKLVEDRTTISVDKSIRKKITRLAVKKGIHIYAFTNAALLFAIKRVSKIQFKEKDKKK